MAHEDHLAALRRRWEQEPESFEALDLLRRACERSGQPLGAEVEARLAALAPAAMRSAARELGARAVPILSWLFQCGPGRHRPLVLELLAGFGREAAAAAPAIRAAFFEDIDGPELADLEATIRGDLKAMIRALGAIAGGDAELTNRLRAIALANERRLRPSALVALDRLGAEDEALLDAVDAVLESCFDDEPAVLAAGRILGRIAGGDERGRALLVARMDRGNQDLSIHLCERAGQLAADHPELLSVLVKQLKAPAATVRMAAIDAIAQVGPEDPAILEQIRELSERDRDSDVKEVALDALQRLGLAVIGDDLPALLAALESEEPELRRQAVARLRKLEVYDRDAREARRSAIALAAADAAWEVRREAARALVDDRGMLARSRDLALRLITDEHDAVSAAAAVSLGPSWPLRSEPELLEAFLENARSEGAERRRAALENIGFFHAFSDRVLPVLRSSLPIEGDRAAALRGIARLGELAAPLLDPLRLLLDDSEPGERPPIFEALRGLGGAARPAAMAVFLSLAVEDDAVKDAACEALVAMKIDEPKILDLLKRKLEDEDTDPFLHINLVRALGAGGARARGAIPTLCALLEGDDDDLGYYVLVALGEIGQDAEAVLPKLVAAGHRYGGDCRAAAIEAVGRFGAAAAIPELLGLFDPEDAECRRALKDALLAIGAPVLDYREQVTAHAEGWDEGLEVLDEIAAAR